VIAHPPSSAESQADALVEEIGRKVAERGRELLDTALREADEIRRRARLKARRQMRRAIEEMRATERQRSQQTLAELETASRRQASLRALDTLSLAWPQLAEAIERRWNDPAAQRHWIGAQVALACKRLPARGWVIRHPGDWSDAGMAALREVLQAHGVVDATLQADAGLCVGLVIEVDGARLDSTPRALLADRPRVEAALLAALEPAGPTGRRDE